MPCEAAEMVAPVAHVLVDTAATGALSLFDVPAVSAALACSFASEEQAARAAAGLRFAALAHALRHGTLPLLSSLVAEGAHCAAAAAALSSGGFVTCSSRVERVQNSADRGTTKLLVRLADGLAIEAVLLRHDSGAGTYAGAPRPGYVSRSAPSVAPSCSPPLTSLRY